eukprot:jgi/Orpsp1_1/1185959/evm.model.c7180000096225.1
MMKNNNYHIINHHYMFPILNHLMVFIQIFRIHLHQVILILLIHHHHHHHQILIIILILHHQRQIL